MRACTAAVPFAHAPRFLILYGSLRERSFSRFLAYEAARLLEAMGGEVRIFDAHGLPLPDDATADHPKVQELRQLSLWSEGHVWVEPRAARQPDRRDEEPDRLAAPVEGSVQIQATKPP